MIILNYEEEISKIENRIAAQNQIVLATADKNRVTARMVYCISDKLSVYFLTSKAYLKYKQIEKNPNVALCFDKVQIEGIASTLGHPTEPQNKDIIQKANTHRGFMDFIKYKNTVLIEVKITSLELWQDNKRVFIDVEKRECYKK